ncbi:macrolide family glycosyltransferase [Nocardia sp. NPDC048505]|uniref:macrolide family glycosyltransferase n=1 Tax=unclassified Nocardia TaxID=2637762 RepID=UPI0033E1D7C3
MPAHLSMIGVPIVSHVLPSLEVLRELVARGHRVTYANDPAVADLVTATGAEFISCTSTLPVADNAWPDDPIAAMTLFLDNAVQALSQLRAAYDADPADLYLYDIGAYAGRALAEKQGRPLLQLSPSFVAWEGYTEEIGAQVRRMPGAAAYYAKFGGWLLDNGATTTEVDAFSGPPERTLALIPRAMQPNADRVDSGRVTFVGPCFPARGAEPAWTRPAAERVLLISLGSAYTRQPEFYRNCLRAFGELPGWHVVLQIGKHVDAAELGSIPPNIEVHSWVPQRAILAAADAFLTHAGMGGCGEGLLAGVPMIAVPQGAEQFQNADRLVELGVARRLDTADATPEALRDALREIVSDPEIAGRCAVLRADAQREGGTVRAVESIERLVATRPAAAPGSR